MATKKYNYIKIYESYLKNFDIENDHTVAVAKTRSELNVHERTMRRIIQTYKNSNPIVEKASTLSVPLVETATELEPKELVTFDREKVKLKAEITQLKSKYKSAIDQLEETQNELAFNVDVKANLRRTVDIPYKSTVSKTKGTRSKHEAIPFMIASDWHFGERVDPSTVNYTNRYDPDIAEDSINKFFDRSAKLINNSRQDVEINTGVLALIGDLMTGYIHDEMRETNHMSPHQELLNLLRILRYKIVELKEKASLKKLIVVCIDGNHGRAQKEKFISSRAQNSHEYFMYHLLAQELANDKSIEFVIPDSVFCQIKIWGLLIRFMHGDMLKYGGGIGGIEVPLKKLLARLNSQEIALMTFLGHFHQVIFGQDFTVNGSIIGPGAYSHQFGFAPTSARQVFLLLDSKRREFTAKYPIFVDDGDRLNMKTKFRTSGYESNVRQTLELS